MYNTTQCALIKILEIADRHTLSHCNVFFSLCCSFIIEKLGEQFEHSFLLLQYYEYNGETSDRRIF